MTLMSCLPLQDYADFQNISHQPLQVFRHPHFLSCSVQP